VFVEAWQDPKEFAERHPNWCRRPCFCPMAAVYRCA
jgi:hypothetical protein